MSIPFPEIVDFLILIDATETTLFWDVIVSDGFASLSSNNGPFDLLIEGGEVLNAKLNIPHSFHLYPNYPNPFNSNTTFRYDIPENHTVTLDIFDVRGNLVRNLLDAKQNAGKKYIEWNGFNNKGQLVGAGVYLFQIKSNDFISTRKMVMFK